MMKKTHLLEWVVLVLTVIILTSLTWAVPGFINYQGKLTDPNSVALEGHHNMKFSIYDAEIDGNSLWEEDQDVIVTNGIYNVQLGSAKSFPKKLFVNDSLYLEVKIFSSATGWEILSPRERITSSAFAMMAGDADTLDGLDSLDLDYAATNHTHNGDDITSGIIDETHIDQAITRDSELATHAAAHSVHHPKTTSFSEMTDMATDAQIPDDITINHAASADLLDGKDSSDFGDSHSLDAVDGDPVDAVYVDEFGNIGIGTTSPASRLHVEGEATIGGHLTAGSLSTNSLSTGSISSGSIDMTSGSNNILYVRDRIKMVSSSGCAHHQWKQTEAGGCDTRLDLRVHTGVGDGYDGGEMISFDRRGNVGIATTSPTEKLDVVGNAKISGDVVIGGNSAVVSQANNIIIQSGKALKNQVWITINFPQPFSGIPNVVVTSHWQNAHSGIGNIETIDTISTNSFTVGSNSYAPNYYVQWIAIGPK